MTERNVEKKKRKLEDENRKFQSEWENLFFFIQVKGNAVCLICRHTITILKLYNLKRHYEQKHGEIDKLTVGERKAKLQSLKNNLTSQQNIFAAHLGSVIFFLAQQPIWVGHPWSKVVRFIFASL